MTDNVDQRLVEQAQNDSQAFAQLYERYVDRIYAYTYRQSGDEALAADVTATTFEKALRHIRRYRWQGHSFGTWLYRIAHNELIQHHRRERFLSPLRRLWSGREDVERAVLANEQHNALQLALTQLSKADRNVITLRFFEELSSADVAKILGCSTQNVYVRLHRALNRLRQHLEALDQLEGEEIYVSE